MPRAYDYNETMVFMSADSRALLLALSLALLLAAAQASSAPTLRDPYTHFFHETFGDFTEELAVAREQGKRGILLFFEMEECPFCRRMEETVLNRSDVQEWYRERFLCFAVDIEGDTEITDFEGNTMTAREFAKVNRVRATPVFAFYDLDGKRIMRFTGATRDAEEFMWLGEFVADGYHEITNFTRFKRAKRAMRGAGVSETKP